MIRKHVEGLKRHASRHCLGALAKACNFTLTLRDKLARFLECPG
jgi:hypothetical protein